MFQSYYRVWKNNDDRSNEPWNIAFEKYELK